MTKPQVFHTISEHFPFRRVRPSRLDTESARLYDELGRETYDAVHFTLADSLARMENGPLAPDRQQELRTAIITDAYDLACRMLSDDTVDLLDLTPKHPDNIAFESASPSLRGLYLLIHAYDRTQDDTLRHVIEYIFSQTPPHLSELLGQAYSNSMSEGSSILSEYRRLAAVCDDRLDGTPASEPATKTPDATQASGEALGATAAQLPHANG